ncbi:hypothetical protein Gohar_021955 [Gossypium harknessii]|uniref:RNase H type-1 domain-containing protein n=1 Tax=Gossypium harknessii TaxID=34285 RepID=A0A7J9I6Y7_9ROSI|nr:hypothetical protein [Gossypium harknessii]
MTVEVWHLLNFSWIMNNMSQTIWEWLIWRKLIPGRPLVLNIQRYVVEQKGLKALKTNEITYRSFSVQELTQNARIHFDAAYDSKTSRSASGLVGWDTRGNLMAIKTVIHRNIPSPFAAEAHACFEGTKLGILLRIHSVKLMGDLKTVIKKCQETSTDKSVIGVIIRDIQQKKSDFQELIFQYIHRSKNLEAHRISKNALEKGKTVYLRGRN